MHVDFSQVSGTLRTFCNLIRSGLTFVASARPSLDFESELELAHTGLRLLSSAGARLCSFLLSPSCKGCSRHLSSMEAGSRNRRGFAVIESFADVMCLGLSGLSPLFKRIHPLGSIDETTSEVRRPSLAFNSTSQKQ
jgi:hypothetical protein